MGAKVALQLFELILDQMHFGLKVLYSTQKVPKPQTIYSYVRNEMIKSENFLLAPDVVVVLETKWHVFQMFAYVYVSQLLKLDNFFFI